MNRFLIHCTIVLLAVSAESLASDQIGTVTQTEGTVKIFTHPSRKLHGEGDDKTPRALFQGEYYRVKDAQIGDRVEKGNILRTAPGAKARIVFDNGDQYNVGGGTAYRVFWDKDAKNAKNEIQLMYGKLRGVVEKGGPRTRLTIKTKSATMGVRGTDFFIAEDAEGATEVSILRGAVEVKPLTPEAKAIEVKAGFSASVAATPAVPATTTASPAMEIAPTEETQVQEFKPAQMVELRRTTQEELTGIQKSSDIAAMKMEDLKAEAKPEVAQLVQELEKKAVETVIQDVKASDPKLYAQIKEMPVKSTAEINQLAVQTLVKDAPKAPAKRKPYKSELEDLEGESYKKYFKTEE